MNINCEIARDLLPLYVDGCLSASSKEALRAHLAVCGECRAYLGAHRERIIAAKHEQPAAPAGDFSSVARRLRQHRALTEAAVGVSMAALLIYGILKTVKNRV